MIETLVEWIVKHKTKSAFIVIGFFCIPLVIVHLLFSCDFGIPFLQSKWSAGDIIAYIAGFEAFVGTLILGAVSIWQNKKAHKISEDAMVISKRMLDIEQQSLLPCFDFDGGQSADNHHFLVLLFYQEYLILRIYLKNVGTGMAKNSQIKSVELYAKDKYYVLNQSAYNEETFGHRCILAGDKFHFHLPLKSIDDVAKISDGNEYLKKCSSGTINGEKIYDNIYDLLIMFELVDAAGNHYNQQIRCTFRGKIESGEIVNPSMDFRELIWG